MLRALLRLAEIPYSLAVRWRNRRYDRGTLPVAQVSVPVVSVGNLTVGGTGKTPMVEWLARWFLARGVRVTLISRGYGAQRGALNDEARELEERLPNVPHLQNPDRVEAAQTAVAELDCQVILLDDGFQHRRIGRDLDVVLLDALEPFGFSHVLPRGTLREPPCGLARADVVALSRSDVVPADRREAIHRQVRKYAPDAVWLELAHRPKSLLASGSKEASIDSLRGKKVAAFCGIGNPQGFRHTLAECGLHVVAMREFPDHHVFDRKDIDSLCRWAENQTGIEAVVCTHKDLVKIEAERLGGRPLWALVIGVEVLRGENALTSRLQSLLDRTGDSRD